MTVVHHKISTMASTSPNTATHTVEILILGAGWTSTFLIPLLKSSSITFAATTTTGRDGTIPFKYDPESGDPSPFQHLPTAQTILITFPLNGKGQSHHLVQLYEATHSPSTLSAIAAGGNHIGGGAKQFHYIQLGSTGIFTAPHWNTCDSSYNTTHTRAIAEDELLALPDSRGCVLNLSGLYGGERVPSNWVDRVVKDKEGLRAKKALHLIHGEDVARGVLAVHRTWDQGVGGNRWLLTDLRVYDWWDLAHSWSMEKLAAFQQERVEAERAHDVAIQRQKDLQRWVGECMIEEDVRALPRGAETLGRVLDSRDFWRKVGIWPSHGRVTGA